MVLAKLKETAEAFLGQDVQGAVVAVPSHFNYVQRQAIRDAGTICGLNVARVITDSFAAATTYTFEKEEDPADKNVLIFDLGAGTLSVTVLVIYFTHFADIKATAGNNHLGGIDFDNRMVFDGYFFSRISIYMTFDYQGQSHRG
jgi:L1 cell adhesion molecule like protein